MVIQLLWMLQYIEKWPAKVPIHRISECHLIGEGGLADVNTDLGMEKIS